MTVEILTSYLTIGMNAQRARMSKRTKSLQYCCLIHYLCSTPKHITQSRTEELQRVKTSHKEHFTETERQYKIFNICLSVGQRFE